MTRYTRQMRALAKEKQRPLVTLSFDCRHIGAGAGEMVEYQGLGHEELIGEICALIRLHRAREQDKWMS
jgi:hypothetical protein